MGNIGSGGGSNYPSSLDTQTSPEVDAPSGSATKERAAVPNDLAACVIACETTLGINPQGSKTDVKTYLQNQHNTDGSHSSITISGTTVATGLITANGGISTPGQITSTVATGTAPIVLASTTPIVGLNLPMTGEATASATSISLGTVTSGDRILVQYYASATGTGTGTIYLTLSASGGATITTNTFNQNLWAQSFSGSISLPIGGVVIVSVTGSGSLTLSYTTTTTGTAPTISTDRWYAFFLKKQ
jgi:hypothetical protein